MAATVAAAPDAHLFRIQYVSDLHIEFYDKKIEFQQLVKPVARYLALAGDIGHPNHPHFVGFMDYVSSHWEHVFYVAGNHEYYNRTSRDHRRTMSEIQDKIREVLSPYKNIHFLHPSSPHYYIADSNVVILGSTLWTHIPSEKTKEAQRCMNDYTCIDIRPFERLHPHDTNSMHAEEKELLKSQIDYWSTVRNANICVVTHHMPSHELIAPQFEGFSLNVCFASSCESLMTPSVRAWLYGHTHSCRVHCIHETFCYVNARGYPSERVSGFVPDAVCEFVCRRE
jgi:predicted phosphodiesterase